MGPDEGRCYLICWELVLESERLEVIKKCGLQSSQQFAPDPSASTRRHCATDVQNQATDADEETLITTGAPHAGRSGTAKGSTGAILFAG